MLTAAVVAPASFAIRLIYPYGSESGFSDLNLWEWPACVAVFGLGIAACRQGWLEAIPEALARSCRRLTLLAAVTMAALLSVAGAKLFTGDKVVAGRWSKGAVNEPFEFTTSDGRQLQLTAGTTWVECALTSMPVRTR